MPIRSNRLLRQLRAGMPTHLWPLIAIALFACLFALALAGPPPTSAPTRKPTAPAANPKIRIVIANRGTIVAELLPAKSPKTTAHILALVKRKFYDHLLFHSVVKGFIATTGDPRSRSVDGAKIAKLSELQVLEKYRLGGGGSGSTVPLETGLDHDRGTLGLKRSERNIDSGDSQFFFNLQDNYTNNVAYCVFGKVVQGLDVMDNIAQGDRITSIRVLGGDQPAGNGTSPKHK